jgi:hypothetical protein
MIELLDQLKTSMSKETARSLAASSIQSQEVLEAIVLAAVEGKSPKDQKAAWVLWAISESNAAVLKPYASRILTAIPKKDKSGTPRDMFKAVSQVKDLTEDELGLALDIAFKNLENTKTAIAEKHSGIGFIRQQLKAFPELTEELIQLLYLQKELGTDPFKRYVNKTIQQL